MCFFKNWVFAFLDDDTFQGGSQVLQNFGHKEGETDRFRFCLGGGGGGGGGGGCRVFQIAVMGGANWKFNWVTGT